MGKKDAEFLSQTCKLKQEWFSLYVFASLVLHRFMPRQDNVTFVVFLYVICNFLKNGVKLRFTVIGRKFVVFVNSLMS